MKNFTKIALSGIVCFALAACGSSSSSDGGTTPPPPPPPVPNDVNYTEVTTATLEAGYKINLDMNHTVIGNYNADYYFCQWDGGANGYFADDTGDWNGSTGYPEFDYGDVDPGTTGNPPITTLVFTPVVGTTVQAALPQGTTSYTITDDNNQTLTEGQTYTFRVPNAGDGNITINTISDFNCSTLEPSPT